MLYLFDIDGTLIRSFMREGAECGGCHGTGKTPAWLPVGEGPTEIDCTVCGGSGEPYDAVEVLPGAREKLDFLRAEGHDVALVTNQGGIAFGHQTSEQINRKLYGVLEVLGFPLAEDRVKGGTYVACTGPGEREGSVPVAYVALRHPKAKIEEWKAPEGDDWRKPGGGMIRQAMRDYGATPEQTMFVGDMETDRQAAEAAGVQFRWADDFMDGVLS